MRFFFLLIFAVLSSVIVSAPAYAEKPVLGIVGMASDSARGSVLLPMIERTLGSTSNTSGIFDLVNTPLLKDQLSRFGCDGERCLSGFAKDAGIAVLVTCSIRDRGDVLIFRFRAYGSDVPYDGKVIAEKTYSLPLRRGASQEEQLYCAEEISIRFFCDLLDVYTNAVICTVRDTEIHASEPLSGRYSIISIQAEAEGFRSGSAVGEYSFISGTAKTDHPAAGDLRALVTYKKKQTELQLFLQGRKKEIVFSQPSLSETFSGLILLPVFSATAPVLAPLGYYSYSDYSGLGLWAVNFAPWAYLQWDGYKKGFPSMKENRSRASADSVARHYFFWYMLCAGNAPLFADAAVTSRLDSASVYKSKEPYLGNTATAVMLSLAGGGGGMFYRGQRAWGYFYYQADNILLYMTLRSMFKSRDRDHSGITSSDVKKGDKAVLYLSAFAAAKTIEILHVMFSDDRLDAVGEVPGSCAFVPGIDFSGASASAFLAVRYAF
jgi:hypothetical protein